MKDISDNKILNLIADDKTFNQGFNLLLKQYQEKLYWNIRNIVHIHEDADDIIQNTFIKVFKNIKGFKQKSKLYTWLYAIARNESLTYLKKKKKHTASPLDDQDNGLENQLKADQFFNGDEAQVILLKAIETLPDRQKEVFRLRYFQELSYKEMSELLNTTVGGLKASFHHAVKKIEQYLKENINYV